MMAPRRMPRKVTENRARKHGKLLAWQVTPPLLTWSVMNISPINPLLLAGKPVTPTSGKPSTPLKVDAREEFLEYARMSPAERLRAQILEDMELSEDSLAAMDPEARAGVEDEIKRRMLEALTGKADAEPGSLVDMSA